VTTASAPSTSLKSISAVAEEAGLRPEHVLPWGRDRAKIDLAALDAPAQGRGKLVLVSAVTPTKAGEGKTTTSIALGMGMRRRGTRVLPCLREPSLGPVFGMKGGATGGGKAQLHPAADINLHFTGDLHAIGAAHNLLAAMVDNDLHFGRGGQTRSGLDPRRVTWSRAMDMNDRALRHVLVGLRGEGVARESRFDITAASEVMAVLCLARDFDDLRARLGRIIVGERSDKSTVSAADVGAAEAMTALLRDAFQPNLVQTREGGPVLVHGGPFANIAHGCSSVISTRLGLHLADVVVTEAGFGFDLGGEKFLDLKCRSAGLWPDAVVLVATLRALASHGGADPKAPGGADPAALDRGLAHLERQLGSVAAFGLTPVVALNVFPNDTEAGLARVEAWCAERGVATGRSLGFAEGGAGAEALAEVVDGVLAEARPREPRFLYPPDVPIPEKLAAVARAIYGADGVDFAEPARRSLRRIEREGYGELPVCIAKTHLSLSDNPAGGGMPTGFRVTVRELRLSAGAGFVVALMGDILTMPGLPKEPAALRVEVDSDGTIRGLMQGE